MNNDQDLARLLDEMAIRRLVARYAECADSKDGDNYVKLYAPNGVLEGDGYRYDTPDKIRDAPTKMTAPFKKLFHMIVNHTIHLDGDRATGTMYCMAHHLSALPEGKYNDHIAYITYHDRYVRGGELGWQFEGRRLVVEFAEDRAVERPEPQVLAASHAKRVNG